MSVFSDCVLKFAILLVHFLMAQRGFAEKLFFCGKTFFWRHKLFKKALFLLIHGELHFRKHFMLNVNNFRKKKAEKKEKI